MILIFEILVVAILLALLGGLGWLFYELGRALHEAIAAFAFRGRK